MIDRGLVAGRGRHAAEVDAREPLGGEIADRVVQPPGDGSAVAGSLVGAVLKVVGGAVPDAEQAAGHRSAVELGEVEARRSSASQDLPDLAPRLRPRDVRRHACGGQQPPRRPLVQAGEDQQVRGGGPRAHLYAQPPRLVDLTADALAHRPEDGLGLERAYDELHPGEGVWWAAGRPLAARIERAELDLDETRPALRRRGPLTERLDEVQAPAAGGGGGVGGG